MVRDETDELRLNFGVNTKPCVRYVYANRASYLHLHPTLSFVCEPKRRLSLSPAFSRLEHELITRERSADNSMNEVWMLAARRSVTDPREEEEACSSCAADTPPRS